MEDFSASRSEFGRLLSDYPDNIYRLDVYYNMYIMSVRENDVAQANKYRDLILEHFPESGYGIAMRDPNYFENLKMMNTHQETLYASAYDAYLNNRNEEVHKAYEYMTEKFPLSRIMPKFMFLHALAYVTDKDTEQFKVTLKELLEKYPDTDITPVASSYLKQLAQGRNLETSSSNVRGMLWDIRLGSDSIANANAMKEAAFTLNENEPHLLVLLFPNDKVSANQLLYDVAMHNFSAFTVEDFDLELMNFGNLGMVIIKGCNDKNELKEYRKKMHESTTFVMPSGVRQVEISESNFKILINEGRSFEEYFNFIGEEDYKATEESVLPPEEFGESEGIPTPEPEETLLEESVQEYAPVEVPVETPVEEPEVKEVVTPPANEEKEQSATKQEPKKEELKNETKNKKIEKTQSSQKQNTIPQQSTPTYPTGSEGDDPLFDIP